MSEEIKKAWEVLKKAAKEDPEWAWAVHCNLAMPVVDEGGSHELGNRAAARMMSVLFDCDITKHPHYKYRDISPEDEQKLMESYRQLHPEISEVPDVPAQTTSTLLEPTDQDLGDVTP